MYEGDDHPGASPKLGQEQKESPRCSDPWTDTEGAACSICVRGGDQPQEKPPHLKGKDGDDDCW